MPNNNQPLQIKTSTRIALYAVIVAVCLFCWIAVRGQIGSMLAELTPPSREGSDEVADFAAGLAPRDPRPKWLAAMKARESFSEDDLNRSVALLEEAIRLSPNDFRLWIELARGYEQAERYDDAERALKHSIELAPSYAVPHWQMGNFLLRQDRVDEAKSELRRATETSSSYRDQVYSLAWNFFDKDPARVEELAAETADARANLARFYADREAGRDALRIWNTLSPEQKQYYHFVARPMSKKLYDTRFVHEALAVARELGIDRDAAEETVNNGGFERPIGDHTETLFGWMIFRNDNKFEAMPDSRIKAEGNRSLRVSFRNYVKPSLYNIAQIVAVQPQTKYRLTFRLRTDNLRSGGPPLLEIAAVTRNERLAATAPFAAGSSDWQDVALEFTVPAGVEGIEIRTVRVICGEECPIAGSFWYDDFKLVRL